MSQFDACQTNTSPTPISRNVELLLGGQAWRRDGERDGAEDTGGVVCVDGWRLPESHVPDLLQVEMKKRKPCSDWMRACTRARHTSGSCRRARREALQKGS